MNIIDIPITLDNIATDRDCAGVIPITKAENTATASVIPNPEGVIAINIVREPKDDDKFPFNNLAYRALIWMVRFWPKQDLHCHIDPSLPESWVVERLIERESDYKPLVDKGLKLIRAEEQGRKENAIASKVRKKIYSGTFQRLKILY